VKLHKPEARKQAALDAWLDRLTILTAAPKAAEKGTKSTSGF
jgi:hypothetical protein